MSLRRLPGASVLRASRGGHRPTRLTSFSGKDITARL
jgi:hypothetical protein